MQGSGPPINWDALAPHIADPTREAIVEAIRWVGPLSAGDVKNLLGDPELCLACLHYHLSVLADREIVLQVGRRTVGGSFESLYFLSLRR